MEVLSDCLPFADHGLCFTFYLLYVIYAASSSQLMKGIRLISANRPSAVRNLHLSQRQQQFKRPGNDMELVCMMLNLNRDGGADNRFGMLLRWFWSISGGAETNQQTIWTWTWKWSSSRSRSLLEMFQFKLEDSGTSVRLESDQQKLLWRSNSNWTHRLDRVDSRLQSTSLQYFSYQFGSHFQSTGPNPAYVHRWCPT